MIRTMAQTRRPCTCQGSNFTITLSKSVLHLSARGFMSDSFEIPVGRIRSVIIERKAVVPFAVFVVILAIAAVIFYYNALWFIFNLSSQYSRTLLAEVSALASGLFLVPLICRLGFVNVKVSWQGDPEVLQVNFVPAPQGRRLAREFREISTESVAAQNEQFDQ